jgi:hypothetical protein
MTLTTKRWTPEREAAALARAERGLAPHELGPAVPNPFRKPGRPALSAAAPSKAVNTRIPPELHRELTEVARRRGCTVSELVREVLTAYAVSIAAEDRDAPAAVPAPDKGAVAR